MSRKNMVVLLVLLVASLLCAGCDGSEMQQGAKEGLEVPSIVATQTVKVEAGPDCEYILISKDIQHRLNHYRVCNANGDDAKRVKALDKALQDCYDLCADTFLSGTDAYTVCIAQCNEE